MRTSLLGVLLLGVVGAAMTAAASERCADLLAPAITPEAFLDPGLQVRPVDSASSSDQKISLHLTQRKSLSGLATNIMAQAVLRPVLKVKNLEAVMSRLQNSLSTQDERSYFSKLLQAFQIQSQFNVQMLEDVPTEGPLIVTMNHPLSGLELVAVAEALQSVRKDVKIVATTFLESVPGLKDHAIFLNPMGGKSVRDYNAAQRVLIEEYLKKGHVIVIAPAGAVSVKDNSSNAVAMDPPWKLGVADLVGRVPGTQVLPVFVDGGPSDLFHKAKSIHPMAGTAMIIREIAEQVGGIIRFAIGTPVSNKELLSFKDRRDLTKYLRLRTYLMSGALPKSEQIPVRQRQEPIADALPEDLVKAEVDRLAPVYDLAPDNPMKGMKAVMALGRDIPLLMIEIGRLREKTFWAAGEGTGQALDLDRFDPDYHHLIVWDKKLSRVAGAYRIGFVNEILRDKGPDGLYTGHYFGIVPYLHNKLSGMFEVGRSFVAPEYQGRSFALPTLFGGLSRLLAHYGNYRGFFGAVSVSNEYSPVSKALILGWAARYAGDAEFGKMTVKTPPQFSTLLSAQDLRYLIEKSPSIQSLNALVESAEGRPGAKTPQLIPIYIELGAKFLGFDHDVTFNTVDGLISTDIRMLPHEVRVKYMQEEAARIFEEKWNISDRIKNTDGH